jgi:hypothetical protein
VSNNFVFMALFSKCRLPPAHSHSPCRTNDVMRALSERQQSLHYRLSLDIECLLYVCFLFIVYWTIYPSSSFVKYLSSFRRVLSSNILALSYLRQ